MFSLNGTLKKSGSVRRWETKQFIAVFLGWPNTTNQAQSEHKKRNPNQLNTTDATHQSNPTCQPTT